MKVVYLIALLAMLNITVSASEINSKKNKNGSRMESLEKEQYKINDKVVSKEEFDKFLKSLKEVPHTWFCAETTNGGMTGYDATDQNGTVYEYRAVTDNGISRSTILKKGSLKPQ
jgi:hypothetical protein